MAPGGRLAVVPPAKLLTIAVSHFCEKARWALDRAGLDYIEKPYLPVAHLIPVKLASGGHSVPVLVDGGTVVADSTVILEHVDQRLPAERRLFPSEPAACAEVMALEETFDDQLGPATRRWAYHHLLPERGTSIRVLWPTLGWWDRIMLVLFFPLVRRLINRGYRINVDSAARSFQRVETVFNQVGDLLKDGRVYLAGGRFSAADLTFAALAGPVVLPDETGATMPRLEDLPAEMSVRVKTLRESPAGAFALRMYRQHRR